MTPSPANTITRRDLWQTLWRFVASDALLAAGAIGLALSLAIVALLPQSPPAGSAAYARWLSDVQLRFGNAAGLFSALGLFDMVHSIVFRACAGLLALTFSARLIDRLHDLRAAAKPVPPPDPPAQALDTDQSVDAIARRLRGFRLRNSATSDIVLADRFPWAYLGSIAAYAGALLMLLGLALAPLIDWRIDGLSVTPDAAAPIPNTPYTLHISGIDASGQVSLALMQNGAPLTQSAAAPGQPVLIRPDVSLFLRERLPALRVSGRDAAGNVLKLQSSAQSAAADQLLLTFDADRPEGFFAVPEAELAVRVSIVRLNASPQYRVVALRTTDAASVAEALIDSGGQLQINDSVFKFEGESHALVAAVHAPAQMIVLSGMIVTIAGLACVAFYPTRRIWLVPGERGARIVSDDPDLDLTQFTPIGQRL
ncbi:MAG TPA: hypothetical protein VJG32_21305 [Anaerolineae bacterium]|nr:hypothetical protein [Anaerolineae bacterium]